MADLIEAALGGLGLAPEQEAADGEHDGGGDAEGDGEAVAAEELGGAVAEGVGPGFDGHALEVGADIFGELFDGGVAAVAVLVDGLENDVVEVAAEVASADGAVVGDGLAGADGDGFADGAGDGGEGGVGDFLGFFAGEELVENDAEGVDVGGGGDGFAADLFGAGVFGGEHLGAGDGDGLVGVVGEDAGDAEIEEFDGAGLVDQDVAGFQVPVND